MNRLDVECEQKLDDCGEAFTHVSFHIDGRPLLEMVREFEAPFAGELAGAYDSHACDCYTADFLTGLEQAGDDEPGKTELLCCTCGCMGCWPLYARITVDGNSVTWDGFEQPHRDWSYEGFGPFVFDLDQYRSAIALIGRRLQT